jgi:predicted Zn-dependent protease
VTEADALWAQAEKLAPYDAIYPWRRAQIAAAEGNWSAAEASAGRAADIEPGFLNAQVLQAEALAHLGRSQAASAELAKVMQKRSQRGAAVNGSGYERTVWDFDHKDYDRVAALVDRAQR